MHGTLGRVLSGASYLSLLIVSAQLTGLINFLPPKVSAIIVAIGATISVFSERVQGGASDPSVRAAAAASDAKDAAEEK